MSGARKAFLVIGGLGDLGLNRILPAVGEMGMTADVVDIAPSPPDLPAAVQQIYPELYGVPCPSRYLGVIVATPNHLHREHCEWAVGEAGLPCLCEKPLAHTLRDAEHMVKLAQRTGLLFAADHYLFKGPSRVIVQQPDLLERVGRLQRVRARILEADDVAAHRGWLLNPCRSGGGIWIDLGIHLVTVMLQILQHSTWTVRSAAPGGFDEEGEIGETSMEVVTTIGSVDAQFQVAKNSERHCKDLLLQGTRGTVLLDWRADELRFDDGTVISHETDPFGGYGAMLEDFASLCRSGIHSRHSLVAPQEALESLRFVKAGYRASDLPDPIWCRSTR